MDNRRTRKPRIIINPPIIPSTLDKKHVGTRVQFSRSTDFESSEDMIYDKTTYLPDNILDIQITNERNEPLEISLDDVYYFRYQLLYDSVSSPTNNPQQYTKDAFSVIASIYGDQEGFRYDHVIVSTPIITGEEENGVLGNNFLSIIANGFKVFTGTGVHKYTTWLVETSDGEVIYKREKDVDNLTQIKFPLDIFTPGKLYVIKAKFITDTNGESNYGRWIYNRSIVNSQYLDVFPVSNLYYGNDLIFRVVSKMPNVTGINAKLVSVIGNTEVEIPATINITKQEIRISPFTDINGVYSLTPTLSITNIFKLYVRPIVNGSTNVVWTDMVYELFMLEYPNVYPFDPACNYPGKYTMLKDLDVGPTVLNSVEFDNGVVPILISGTNKLKLYSRYGQSLRPTSIEFELPLLGNNVILPYINVLKLYNGNFVVNYCLLEDTKKYKQSTWAFYSFNSNTNTPTLIDVETFEDEHFSTAVSSSAFVSRDGGIYYIPSEYIEKAPLDDITGLKGRYDYSGLNPDGTSLSPSLPIEGNLGNLTRRGDANLIYSVKNDMINYYTKANHSDSEKLLNVDISSLTQNNETGFSLDLDFIWPSNFSQGATIDTNWPGVLNIDNGRELGVALGVDRQQSNGSTVRFNWQVSGGDGSNDVGNNKPKDELMKITLVFIPGRVKFYINGELAVNRTTNRALNFFTKFHIGYGRNFNNRTEFYFNNVNLYNRPLSDEEVKAARPTPYRYRNIELPIMRIGLTPLNKIERTKLHNQAVEGVYRHICLIPWKTNDTNEEILMVGGTTNDRIQVGSQVGIFKYALTNRSLVKLKIQNKNIVKEPVLSNSRPVELPTDSITADFYNFAGYKRADNKIVLFSNCENGVYSTNTASYVIDPASITSTELRPGWFKVDNNDSRIDVPFRSTVSMMNGDFVRLSYLETLVDTGLSCKVLLYPHNPLTDYVDTDDPITINKVLTVPRNKVISISNPYLYERILIEGSSPEDTGTLIWTDLNKKRVFDYTWRIITRDTSVTTAEDRAQNKERLFILDGVSYQVKD